MPLILRENIGNGEIGLWEITEDIDELLLKSRLSFGDRKTYSGIVAPHRKKEWLATRALLNEQLNGARTIKYHDDGRPYIENCTINISISHSNNYVAIFFHPDSLPGIDIELVTRQVGRVASRFLSPDELVACHNFQELSDRGLLLYWCAKEAVFKMAPFSNIDFATDIHILADDIGNDSGTFQGFFGRGMGKVTIDLHYSILDNVMIVCGSVGKERFEP